MKRIAIGLTALTLLSITACSQREQGREGIGGESSSEDLKSFDVQDEASAPSAPLQSAPPGIVPTAAPGVAFNYRYGFRLPDANITVAQEVHAAACEKLGLGRCRITGMTYQLDDRDRVDATLALSIDPLLARAFGRDAITVVEKQEGRLRYADITGEDQNPALDDAARRQGSANSTIAQLEADLAKAKGENERVQLREQIRQMRAEIQAAQSAAVESEAKIQRTPMTFAYAGGGAAGRGFAGENPATEAWYLFVDSLATMVSFALKALAVALPWLLLLGLAILAIRSRLGLGLRRWWMGQSDKANPPETGA